MQLLAELKRRNVFRMAGLYLVVAWLIVQVTETVLPVFDVPNWVLRVIIILLAVGFVPALVVSWIFELTPEGLQRDEDVHTGDPGYTGVERRLRHGAVQRLQSGIAFRHSWRSRSGEGAGSGPAPSGISYSSMSTPSKRWLPKGCIL